MVEHHRECAEILTTYNLLLYTKHKNESWYANMHVLHAGTTNIYGTVYGCCRERDKNKWLTSTWLTNVTRQQRTVVEMVTLQMPMAYLGKEELLLSLMWKMLSKQYISSNLKLYFAQSFVVLCGITSIPVFKRYFCPVPVHF